MTLGASVYIANPVAAGLLALQGTYRMEVLDDAGCKQVDEQLAAWRQGDCVLGEPWFLFRADNKRPLTRDALAVSRPAQHSRAFRPAWSLNHLCDPLPKC